MSDNDMNDDWTNDVETILDNIQKNCKILAGHHKENYSYYKNILQYFRLPVIVISAFNSIISVGLQSYMEQSMISITTCGLSLLSGIICSIELFYDLQKLMEIEFTQYKQYNLLALDIYKIRTLDRVRRPLPQTEYLNKVYNEYTKLIETSRLVDDDILINDIKLLSNTEHNNHNHNEEQHNSQFIELTIEN